MSMTDPVPSAAPAGQVLPPNLDAKWLPGEPHRIAIVEALSKGIAHVVSRGHGEAPVLVFQDGGVIPLPLVRYENTARGMQLVAGTLPDTPDQTKHRDVCGSIDELKACVSANPAAAAAEYELLQRLMRDVKHMLGRLRKRCDDYAHFAADLQRMADAITDFEGPLADAGDAELTSLLARFEQATPESLSADKEALFAEAETVREVANALEGFIRNGRSRALEVAALFRGIKGGRCWDSSDQRV